MAKITVYPWNEWPDRKLPNAFGILIGTEPTKKSSGEKKEPMVGEPEPEAPDKEG